MTLHKTLAIRVGLSGALIYLAVHAVAGGNGLAAYVPLQQEERALEAQARALQAERRALEARTERLRAQIDRDYLDERARSLLGASRADELTFDRAELLGEDALD